MNGRARGSIMRSLALVAVAMMLPAPVLAQSSVFAISAGGTGDDFGHAIAVDSNGNSYVSGEFEGTVDFDPGAGTKNRTSLGDADVFVAKYDSAGVLRWVVSLGSTGADRPSDIDLGSGNTLVVVGRFTGTVDFDPGPGSHLLTSAGGTDAFILRLNRRAGAFVWAARVGGTSDDVAHSVSWSGTTRLHVGGEFRDTVDFDPGAGVVNRTSGGD